MKHVEKTAHDLPLDRDSAPRRFVDFMCRALATYTPSGPGSLATGQSAAAGRAGPYVRNGGCEHQDTRDHSHPTFAEFAMPLR